jgi:hypothetical protein
MLRYSLSKRTLRALGNREYVIATVAHADIHEPGGRLLDARGGDAYAASSHGYAANHSGVVVASVRGLVGRELSRYQSVNSHR